MKGTWKLFKDSGEQLLCSCGGFSTGTAANSASLSHKQRQSMRVSQFGHVVSVRCRARVCPPETAGLQ